jgi:acyl-coenzyme A synthetase/AMP-(fatty) acid ligase
MAETLAPDKVLVVAYVVLHPGATDGPDAILAWGRERLASYKAPRIVYAVDDLPRTRNGKVLRRELVPALARTRSTR